MNLTDYEKQRQEAYEALVKRVPQDRREQIFVYVISCGVGWKDVVLNLVDELDQVWNGFNKKKGSDCWKLLQVKEKFGGLTFYAKYPEGAPKDRMQASYRAIAEAETEAWKTCERCGKVGHTSSVGYYIATVCDTCEGRWKERHLKGLIPTLFG